MSRESTRALVALPIGAEHLAALQAAAPDWTFDCTETLTPGKTLPDDLLATAEVLISDFPPLNFTAMKALRWIQLGSAGYTQLSGLLLADLGIRATNASGVNDVPIAEWCVLQMLAFERDLPGLLQAQEARAWDRQARFQSELRGSRVGIIGYGSIGRQVARVSRALGLEVWALNRTPIGPAGNRYVPDGTGDLDGTLPHRTFTMDELDDFLPHLDYLVLTAALNAGTEGLLGERELRLLPPHAVVLNPARARLVNEAALGKALREGWIAGAALDAQYREPLPPDDPTWEFPNAILTPHISGSTLSPQREVRLWDLVAQNVGRYQQGQPLLNEIPPADLGG